VSVLCASHIRLGQRAHLVRAQRCCREKAAATRQTIAQCNKRETRLQVKYNRSAHVQQHFLSKFSCSYFLSPIKKNLLFCLNVNILAPPSFVYFPEFSHQKNADGRLDVAFSRFSPTNQLLPEIPTGPEERAQETSEQHLAKVRHRSTSSLKRHTPYVHYRASCPSSRHRILHLVLF
jgi:hypothetical protein